LYRMKLQIHAVASGASVQNMAIRKYSGIRQA
jgi:hypothetical protein